MNNIIMSDNGLINPQLVEEHWTCTWKNARTTPASAATLYHKDEPVSVVRFFNSTLHFPGISMDFVGIGGVYTAPEHRGKGHASTLLRFCFDKSQHLFPGLLFYGLFATKRNLYRDVGFTVLLSHKQFGYFLTLSLSHPLRFHLVDDFALDYVTKRMEHF